MLIFNFTGDIRNDLYLTLAQGEYSRGSSKSSERNVEVNVTVRNDKGQLIKVSSSESQINSKNFISSYLSTVYTI